MGARQAPSISAGLRPGDLIDGTDRHLFQALRYPLAIFPSNGGRGGAHVTASPARNADPRTASALSRIFCNGAGEAGGRSETCLPHRGMGMTWTTASERGGALIEDVVARSC